MTRRLNPTPSKVRSSAGKLLPEHPRSTELLLPPWSATGPPWEDPLGRRREDNFLSISPRSVVVYLFLCWISRLGCGVAGENPKKQAGVESRIVWYRRREGPLQPLSQFFFQILPRSRTRQFRRKKRSASRKKKVFETCLSRPFFTFGQGQAAASRRNHL